MDFEFEASLPGKENSESIPHMLAHQHYEIKYSQLVIAEEDNLDLFILNEICHMFIQVSNSVLVQS